MHTASEIIALARQAHVPFGAHAFIVVQENGGFFAEASYVVNPQMTAERARDDAKAFAAYRKHRQPSRDFHVLEVGAPVNGADLIAEMADLIDEAIEAHIYGDGDEVPAECRYHAALRKARAFAASQERGEAIGAEAVALARILAMPLYQNGLSEDPEDVLNGLNVLAVQAQTLDLEPISEADLPDRDDTTRIEFYTAALASARKDAGISE